MSISSKGHKKQFAELFRFIGAGMNQLKWLKLKKKKVAKRENYFCSVWGKFNRWYVLGDSALSKLFRNVFQKQLHVDFIFTKKMELFVVPLQKLILN